MTLDIHQILKMLPHRYPILLVDRVLELDKGKSIKAIKNVSINEPFSGAFPAPSCYAGRVDFGGLGTSCCYSCV